MSKGMTPKRHSHDYLSCVPWMNAKVFFFRTWYNVSLSVFMRFLLWFKKSFRQDKKNKFTNTTGETNSGDSTHWNISIIMLYSSTQSESSVFVVKKFLGVYCSESQKSFLTQCKTLHYTSWAITVHSSP